MDWMRILFVIVAGLLVWFGWWFIKRNPDWFNRESLGKSFSVLTVLAIVLIVFIGFLILLIRPS